MNILELTCLQVYIEQQIKQISEMNNEFIHTNCNINNDYSRVYYAF